MNIVQITGHLGKDPVVRSTKTGKAVASFSLASSRFYKTPQGEEKELTDWVNVVAWGALAEAARNSLHKGNYVYIEGRYSTQSYDAQDGTKRYITEVVANMIALPLSTMQPKPSGNFSQFGQTIPEPTKQEMMGPPNDEDIPF